jgi:CRP/FNR family transcriptional regulator, cyclic AMP receptor protein
MQSQMTDSNLFLNLFRHKEGKPYPAGQTIVEAGTMGTTMYVVLDGQVEIHVGDRQSVGGPGTIFGEMALIDDAPRSATVVAKTECRLLELDRRRFESLVSETPYFALEVMHVMADRLRQTNANAASA